MNNLTLNPLSNKLKSKPRLHSLPLDNAEQDTLPISVLIDPHSHTPLSLPRDQMLFCYQALLNTVNSVLSKQYTDFDGHTTSHCCHGIALLAWHLIQMVLELDLNAVKSQCQQAIYCLEQHTDPKTPLPCTDHAPTTLVNLASLYILRLIKEPNPLKGGRTVTQKLKLLAPISVNACNHVCRSLQRLFANWTAINYDFYLDVLNKDMHVSNAPVALWGKYIGPDFIRSDKRGIKYVSNLFSTQIVLAYLSQSRAKVALVNEIRSPSSNQSLDKYICAFEGDGQGGFNPLSNEHLHMLYAMEQDEPVVILGGCMYSDTMNKDSLHLKMQPWLTKLTQLILACDVFYPQFFKVNEDSEFDSTPIVPDEESLQKIMDAHSTFGTHPKDPSLYCSTHIHPASLKQVVKAALFKDVHSLPSFSIPRNQLQI